MKQTKIVASISDRKCDKEFIRKLFFAGVNVVRMNTAHATPDGIKNIIKNVREVSPHLALMIDTKGPEVRTTGVEEPIEYKAGDTVRVWGPLGNGFAMEPDTPTLLLAGGMGIVPFVGYVSEHPKPWNVTMLFGHREPLSCYPVDSINEHVPLDSLRETVPGDLDNFIFTIQERMREYAEQKGLILACGPLPFLKTVHGFARELNARVQLSLENRMACGVGACLGCVTRTTEEWPVADKRNGLVQTCNHGPVFWANQIEL